MDFQLKQWTNQQYELEEQHISAKIPKLDSNINPHQKPELESHNDSALPLFVPKLSLSPTATTTSSFSSSRLPIGIMGSGYFSVSQWQELELQALIFRYMVAGAAVPAELLQPIKKSLTNFLINTPHYFLQPYHQQHALFETGYWGRAAMDPEPGRCRRTDGKKWRCSRDVVPSQKYCERHVHRGRNRSRKPVESGSHPAVPGKHPSHVAPTPSGDLLCLSRSSSNVKLVSEPSGETKSGGHHVLRPFFDDWPRSRLEPDNDTSVTTTSLSISTPGNASSDVSLKLSTGGDGDGPMGDRPRRQSGWVAAGWASSSGGPLAEALRSSTTNSNSSPTSVLHQLPRPVPFGS